MNYTDREIAAVAWAANAGLQVLHGDPAPSLPGDAGDAGAHAVTLAGIRAILEGAAPEQLHGTWMRAREAQGWTQGPQKDSRLKTHPAMVPYADLPEYQKVKDRVFAAIVLAMTDRALPGAVSPDLSCTCCTPDGGTADGRHPDGCSCQFCREDIRDAQAQDDGGDDAPGSVSIGSPEDGDYDDCEPTL